MNIFERNEELSTIAADSLFESGKKKHWSKIILSPLWSFFTWVLFTAGIFRWLLWLYYCNANSQSVFLKYQKLRRLTKHNKKASSGNA